MEAAGFDLLPSLGAVILAYVRKTRRFLSKNNKIDLGGEAISPVPLLCFRVPVLIILTSLLMGCSIDRVAVLASERAYVFLGLAAAIGGILGALARAHRWKLWAGAAVPPIAAVGTFQSGLSPVANAGRFFTTLILLSVIGVMAFIIVCFGKPTGGGHGRFGGGASDLGNGGFGGSGSFGGGGASGSW